MDTVKTITFSLLLAVALTSPAFATGRQIICETPNGGNYIPFWGNVVDGIRFQTLLRQAEINFAGEINMVEYYNVSGTAGTFNNYKLYLCHTDRKSLSKTFADNYKGTPVKAADLGSISIPAVVGWFELGMTNTFNYNKADSLLVEVRWQGDTGTGVAIIRGGISAVNFRVYAFNNPEAPIGNADGIPYYTRLSFGAYAGVTPASLGRVKALFK